jgi:hypothetical protein
MEAMKHVMVVMELLYFTIRIIHADNPELFVITVLVQNDNGTWTQSRSDSNGDSLVNN